MTEDFDVEDGLPPWGQVPRHVMLDKRLSNNDRALYATLATYANRKTREAFPKQSLLGEVLGSERTVRRSAKSLEKLGLLKQRHVRGPNGRYAITVYRLLGFSGHLDPIQRPLQASGDADQWPGEVKDHRPGGVKPEPIRSTDQTTTDQEDPGPAARSPSDSPGNGRKDPARANRLIEAYREWYERVYGLVHPPGRKDQVFRLDTTVRSIETLQRTRKMFPDSTTEEVFLSMVEVARQDAPTFWFLRGGETLLLETALKQWHPLFEHLQRFAQRRGILPKFEGRQVRAGERQAIGG